MLLTCSSEERKTNYEPSINVYIHNHKFAAQLHNKQQGGEVSVTADSAKILSGFYTLKFSKT